MAIVVSFHDHRSGCFFRPLESKKWVVILTSEKMAIQLYDRLLMKVDTRRTPHESMETHTLQKD